MRTPARPLARVTGRLRRSARLPGEDRAGDLRVLMIEDRIGEDGAARSNLRLVARWAAAGVTAPLFVVQRAATTAPLPPGVRPIYPAARRSLRLRSAVVLGVVRAAVLARRSDVVVSGREIGFGLLVGRLVAAVTRRPFVVMIRSAPAAALDQYVTRRLRPLAARSLRTADQVVCISPGLVGPAQDLGIDPSRISMVVNGVEVARIRDAATAAPADLPPGDGPLVVGIGRLDHQKGFDVLVRAHARVVAAGVPHRLLILGEGARRADLSRLAGELGVAGTVHLAGFTDNPLPTLAAADLYCLTSRWEGFGQTLAEALVLGTPVVSTDCVSGPRYLLDDGARGDLVPVDDVDALATAIERHLRSPGRLAAMAATGQEWAVANLDVDRTAAGVLDVLREVAGRHRSRVR